MMKCGWLITLGEEKKSNIGAKDNFSAVAEADQTIVIPVMSNYHVFTSKAFRVHRE